MDKFAEWMLVNMFGKYYAEIGNWECLMEKGMSCICVSGEMLNHAISAMLMFYSMPNMEYDVKFIDIEDALCPKLVKVTGENAEIPYIGIKKDEQCDYNAGVTGFPKCEKNVIDDQLYIKYSKEKFDRALQTCDLKDCKTNEQKYEKLILKLEARLINSCQTVDQKGSNYGMLRNSMMLQTIRRMRILNNSNVKKALLAIPFFLGAKESFTLLKNYVYNAEFNDSQKRIVKDFVDKYKSFIGDLNCRGEQNKVVISVDGFATTFYTVWKVDISHMLYECIEKNGEMTVFLNMLRKCVEENTSDDLKMLIEEIEQKVEV